MTDTFFRVPRCDAQNLSATAAKDVPADAKYAPNEENDDEEDDEEDDEDDDDDDDDDDWPVVRQPPVVTSFKNRSLIPSSRADSANTSATHALARGFPLSSSRADSANTSATHALARGSPLSFIQPPPATCAIF